MMSSQALRTECYQPGSVNRLAWLPCDSLSVMQREVLRAAEGRRQRVSEASPRADVSIGFRSLRKGSISRVWPSLRAPIDTDEINIYNYQAVRTCRASDWCPELCVKVLILYQCRL